MKSNNYDNDGSSSQVVDNSEQSIPNNSSPVPDTNQESERMMSRVIDKFPVNSEESVKGNGDAQQKERENTYDEGKYVKPRIVQEVPMFVPRVEVHQVLKEVPKFEIEYIEKVVEVPQVKYIDKYEEVTKIQYVPRRVPKIEIIEVPKDVKKYIPKNETRTIEQVIEVPSGEKVPIAQPQPVTAEFVVPKFSDTRIPVIMGETITPEIIETNDVIEVDVKRYVPKLIYVDVHVPLPVNVPMKDAGIIEQKEVPVNIDPHLLQRMTVEMNPHLHQLECFNRSQSNLFQRLINESNEISCAHGFAAPQPKTLEMVNMDDECRMRGVQPKPLATPDMYEQNYNTPKQVVSSRYNYGVNQRVRSNAQLQSPLPSRRPSQANSRTSSIRSVSVSPRA